MSLALENKRLKNLQERARMFKQVRSFFEEREVLEVDCPQLTKAPSIDTHIDPIQAEAHYLITSPEYGMKRLLSEGIGDCYQLCHVFRKEERSKLHNPEFTLLEWYRIGFTFDQMIDESCTLIGLFIGSQEIEPITYQCAFKKYANLDPFIASKEEILQVISSFTDVPHATIHDSKDDLLNLLLPLAVEPHLGQEKLSVLTHYPASQAALAQTTTIDGNKVAKRFEIYFKGVELANGYHELTDAKEQKERFEQANEERKNLGKKDLSLDKLFLNALEKGLPNCCGVAIGFDRLMMLRLDEERIDSVLPFS